MFLGDSQIVAAVQFAPTLLNAQANVAVGLQLAFEAAAKGAKLIVLPELCTSGMVIRSLREAASVCQEKNGWQTELFSTIANRFNCHVAFGYVELCEGNFYNSAAIVGPCGLEANFQKHNLYGPENQWATPSEQVPSIVLTGAGRTGVLICRDVGNNFRESYSFYNPKHRFYRKGSVDTICLLSNWGADYAYPDSAWVELVESTGANLIVSNRVGRERDMEFKGGSVVIDRSRRIYTFGSSFTEAAVVGGIVELG